MGRGAQNPDVVAAMSSRARTRVPRQHTVALADGRKMAYRHWAGRGRPMILLHGMLDNSASWDELANISKRPVIAIDMPGFGKSDSVREPTLEGYAEDIKETIEALGYDNFILVGHSLGGGTAAKLAELMPEKINRLLLVAPVGFGKNKLAEFTQLPGVKDFVKLTMPLAIHNPAIVTGAYMTMVTSGRLPQWKLLRSIISNTKHAGSALDAINAIASSDDGEGAMFRHRSPYTGPVATLWGEDDHLVSIKHQEGMLHAFPQASIETWDMGHYPQHERPRELSDYVEKIGRQQYRRVAEKQEPAKATAGKPVVDKSAAEKPAVEKPVRTKITHRKPAATKPTVHAEGAPETVVAKPARPKRTPKADSA